MANYRTVLLLAAFLGFSGLPAYASNLLGLAIPGTEIRSSVEGESADLLYQQSLRFLVFGEIEAAKSRLLASVKRDPQHRASQKKLCALFASTSASRALPHCQAWVKLETHLPARQFAHRFAVRLAESATPAIKSPREP